MKENIRTLGITSVSTRETSGLGLPEGKSKIDSFQGIKFFFSTDDDVVVMWSELVIELILLRKDQSRSFVGNY